MKNLFENDPILSEAFAIIEGRVPKQSKAKYKQGDVVQFTNYPKMFDELIAMGYNPSDAQLITDILYNTLCTINYYVETSDGFVYVAEHSTGTYSFTEQCFRRV